MDSLLNEMKYDFKRGQKIKYFDHIDKVKIGTYVMASSLDDHIVLDRGNGQPVVVPVSKVWAVGNKIIK